MTGVPPRDDLLALVTAEVARVLDVDAVSPDAALADDLGADSLDLVETVERVERALRDAGWVARLEDDDVRRIRTPRDAAEALHRTLRASS